MKKTRKNTTMGMSLGMCFGVAIGCAFGQSVFDNMATGMTLGLSIGMCLGMVLGAVKDNAINRQLEEQGYKIKDIHPSQEENFLYVIIVNYKGEEQTVIISKDELEAETLSVGDYVFLDEEGLLEKAYDDDEADE